MLPRGRLWLLYRGLAVWALVVWFRLAQVQLLDHGDWAQLASEQQEKSIEVQQPGGEILMRDGRVLAGSLEVIALGLAYAVGWLTAMVAIRVYGNLILPILINWFAWACLAGVCYLYVEILERLYLQQYDLWRFLKYMIVMAAGLVAMVGLHLIIEEHNLRPFAIRLLIISLIQLGLIVYRYVFVGAVSSIYLLGDVTFLYGMSVFSIITLAHVGLLEPLQWTRFTNYFDMNSTSIRTQD